MGVDVASFGDYEAKPEQATPLVYRRSVPRRLQEAALQPRRHAAARRRSGGRRRRTTARCWRSAASGEPLPCPPGELMLPPGAKPAAAARTSLPDSAQVCSCNNVSKAQICEAIREQELTTLAKSRPAPRPAPAAAAAFRWSPICSISSWRPRARRSSSTSASTSPYTRQELFQIVKIKQIKTFDELLASHGRGARLRNLQAGRGLDPGQPVERTHPRSRRTRRCRTPTTASWPTCSAAGCTPSCRACPAARSRPTSSSPWAGSPRSTASTPRSPAASASICSARRSSSFPTSGKR